MADKKIQKGFFNYLTSINDVRIGVRLIGVTMFVLVILVISIAFLSRIFFSSHSEKEKNEISKAKLIGFQRQVDALLNHALYNATICAEMPAVHQAYDEYYKTKDLEKSAKLIENEFNKIDNRVNNTTIFEPRIHFHLPPAKSFLRSWSSKKGDDISSFRETIVQISKYQTPISGIEIGRAGLVFRGIAPIFNEKYKYLGSVECFFSMKDVFSSIQLDKNEYLALYVKNEKSEIFNNFFENNKSDTITRKKGKFVLIESSSNQFKHEFITRQFLQETIDFGQGITEDKQNIFASVPIKDYSGESVGVAILQLDKSSSEYFKNYMSTVITIIGFLSLTLLIFIFNWVVGKYVTLPLGYIKQNIKKLSRGEIPEKLHFTLKDEITEISDDLNIITKNRQNLTSYAKEISEGKLDNEVEVLSENDDLGYSIRLMQKKLLENRQLQQKREEEDNMRAWSSEGLAKFNEILRKDSALEDLAFELIVNLVDFLNANQGGLFILDDDDKYEKKKYSLVASYAYDKRRFHQKEIIHGEGLVGMAAIENQTLHITDVPNSYIELTSGLGEATPTNILIVPLSMEGNVLGIIEMASFNLFSAHEINFAENIAKSIASTISISRINKKTQALLQETKFQAEQMASQEEEMRQNMEELTATQEEMRRKEILQADEILKLNNENEAKIKQLQVKEAEMTGILKAMNNSTFMIEYDMEGRIIFANDYVANLFGINANDMLGKRQSQFVEYTEEQHRFSRILWERLKSGEIINRVNSIKIRGKTYWLSETYTPIFDEEGKPYKVLKISHDITNEKERESKLKIAMEEIESIKSSQTRTIDKILKKSQRKEAKLREEIKNLKNRINNK